MSALLPILLVVALLFFLLWFFVSRYRRCPSDKILVIYGKTGKGSANCIHGGAAFVWPVIQDYQYLDLQPMSIDVNLQDALSKQNIRVSVPAQFTVAIGNEPTLMTSAAERLLGMQKDAIRHLAHDIIMGQMRLVIANMDIEELNSDRDKFVTSVYEHVGDELHKIGLSLINVNVTDIHDESGYIKALGQEAAAKAINDAKVKVAKEERTGAIGQAEADKERRTSVAAADSAAEIGEKNAQADAIKGKNLADIQIAKSDADRRQQVAEANKTAEVTEKTTEAEAQRAAYLAQKEAEEARKERELAARRANEVVQSQIEKEKTVIAAEAEAEHKRKVAEGEAAAILANYEAQAEGIRKVLDAQAAGFQKLVDAANGNPQAAIGLLMVDKIPELAKLQAEAIKNIKFDKVTVFDGGDGQGAAGFMSGLFKAIPALSEFMNQSGLSLPEYLAKNGNGNGHGNGNGEPAEKEVIIKKTKKE
ncbi:flotillin [Flavilitoribacter nigricans DSM 23189 = NBRC 102662]|uniref:Flotillin n=2 Tax=Flavilitoribacter TaxID=2762562 RepID=A0A2D0NCA2_FLAN2|nr:flotillin [Flavilitoribacter nigricans DSM 23189 = NBRC 102662]